MNNNEKQPGKKKSIRLWLIIAGTLSLGISTPSTLAESRFHRGRVDFARGNGRHRHLSPPVKAAGKSHGFTY